MMMFLFHNVTLVSLKSNIKIPDLLLLTNPYAILLTDNKEDIYTENILTLSKEEKDIFLTFDIIKNENINLKFQDMIIDSNYDIEILNGNKNENTISRLNITENTDEDIYDKFPLVKIIIPQNEIIKENSLKLFEFLK